MSRVLAACALVVTGFSAIAPASAQIIRDDFGGPELAPQRWYVCNREENQFDVVKPQGQPFRAARTVVFPRPPVLATFGLTLRHAGCADDQGEYQRGNEERAELWEADAIRQKAGTEVWY